MTHIGYLLKYDEYARGVLIDVNRIRHFFPKKENDKLKRFQFVTFEGEDTKVHNVISLENYPLLNPVDEITEKFFIQNKYNDKTYILKDIKGVTYQLDNAEAFIVDRLYNKESLLPSTLPLINDTKFNDLLKEIISKVEYVNSHLAEIAFSYRIYLKHWTYTRPCGDDNTGFDRITKLSYRDAYLNKFFLDNGKLYDNEPFPDFKHSYCEGRDIKGELYDIKNFLTNYNKEEHLSALLYDSLKNMYIKQMNQIIVNEKFASYWGIVIEDYHYIDKHSSYVLNGTVYYGDSIHDNIMHPK